MSGTLIELLEGKVKMNRAMFSDRAANFLHRYIILCLSGYFMEICTSGLPAVLCPQQRSAVVCRDQRKVRNTACCNSFVEMPANWMNSKQNLELVGFLSSFTVWP